MTSSVPSLAMFVPRLNVVGTIAIAAVLLCSCDPALFYRVPGWQEIQDDGVSYEGEVHPGVKARVHSSGFGGGLGVKLDILNVSVPGLSFDGSTMYFADLGGRRLPPDTIDRPQCQYSTTIPAVLSVGQTLTASCGWSAKLSGIPGLTRNSDLERVVLVQPGLVGPSGPVPVAIRMTRL